VHDPWVAVGVTETPFRCPRCGAVSHNPNDKREGYCGRCHDWTAPPESPHRWIAPPEREP